jgi:RsiW-degrading membrane proteinase PrsW (M82 family)
MIISLLAVSALVPSALLVWYFHARDVYPEPPRVLWTTFSLGVLSVIPVLVMGYPFYEAASSLDNPVLRSLLSALFVAAIPEEFVKLAILVGYNMRHKAFDEPMDGIVYGVVASLGFATLENMLFVFEGGLSVAASRAFTAVPLHAFVGAIMGFYVGKAFFATAHKSRIILKGYGIAVLLHTLYDFPLMAMAEVEKGSTAVLLVLLTLLVLLVCWRWTVRLVRRLHNVQRAAAGDTEGARVAGVPAKQRRPLLQRMVPLMIAIAGGMMASFGGMVSLGLILAFLIDAVQKEHRLDVVIGGVLVGLIPLVVGMGIFRSGVRGMNAEAVPLPAPARPSDQPAAG